MTAPSKPAVCRARVRTIQDVDSPIRGQVRCGVAQDLQNRLAIGGAEVCEIWMFVFACENRMKPLEYGLTEWGREIAKGF